MKKLSLGFLFISSQFPWIKKLQRKYETFVYLDLKCISCVDCSFALNAQNVLKFRFFLKRFYMVNRYLTIHAMQKGGEIIETAVFFATNTFVMMMWWTTTLIAKKTLVEDVFSISKCSLCSFLDSWPKITLSYVDLNRKHRINFSLFTCKRTYFPLGRATICKRQQVI